MTIALIILLLMSTLVFLFVITVLVLMLISTVITRVPFVPISKRVLQHAIQSYSHNVSSGVFYDLGSGDGRVVFAFAEAFPNARATGFEIGPLPYLLSKISEMQTRRRNARIKYASFLKADLSDSTHIFMYLFPYMVEQLFAKFQKELRPGTEVISCDFPFKSKEPIRTITINGGVSKHTLYVYEF